MFSTISSWKDAPVSWKKLNIIIIFVEVIFFCWHFSYVVWRPLQSLKNIWDIIPKPISEFLHAGVILRSHVYFQSSWLDTSNNLNEILFTMLKSIWTICSYWFERYLCEIRSEMQPFEIWGEPTVSEPILHSSLSCH